MFIELTDDKDNKFTINARYISSYRKQFRGMGTSITMDNYGLIASESYEQVKKLIENEVAAERGY